MNIVPIDKHEATTLWSLGVPVYYSTIHEPEEWHGAVGYSADCQYTPPCEYVTFSWGVEAE